MPTRHVSPQEASRILHRLSDRLEASGELQDRLARAVLEQAKRNASLRPTPQAPMVAETMVVEAGRIISLPGDSPPAEVAIGSELGSMIYRQFGPRSSRGYWLYPAAAEPDADTLGEGEAWVEEQLEESVRGF